jgi:nitrile hydratase subunit beta
VNGIHDMGGMHGFGPVIPERDEPVFHAEFERRTFALALAMMGHRSFNVDEYRRTIERMPPAQYLAATYYEKWLYALEQLLIEKGVVERHEIDVVMAALCVAARSPAHAAPGVADITAVAPASDAENGHHEGGLSEALGGGARSLRFDRSYPPRFNAGDRVHARNLNPEHHTRLPRYVRGHHGVIHRDWGVFIFPDTHAHGEATQPQHCYAVEFDARELWGNSHPAGERVYVDLWEDYLDPYPHVASVAGAKTRLGGGRKRPAKSSSEERATKTARIRAVKKRARTPPET